MLWATYCFFPERFGGTEVYVAGAARGLRRLGHSVSVVAGTTRATSSPTTPFEIRETNYEGIPVHFFSIRTEGLRWEELLCLEAEALTAWWREWLKRNPYDLLHVHGYSPVCSGSLVTAAKQMGLPVAMSFHHPGLLCARGDFVQAWNHPCDGQVRVGRCSVCFGLTKVKALMAERQGDSAVPSPNTESGGRELRFKMGTAFSLTRQFRLKLRSWNRLISQVDGWHAFSDQTRGMLLRNGVPESRIQMIPHAVELPAAITRKESPVIRVGCIGRFHPEKGTHLLVQAIQKIPERLPLQFIFYGMAHGEREKKVQALVAALAQRDPRVALAGSFEPAHLAEVFSGLDVVVVPSIAFETGPLVALEAFHAGIPVVGPRWGSLPSLVKDGVNGLLFPWADARALARCLQRIATEPDLLKQLQSGVRPPGNMENHVQALLGFYERLLKCR